MTYTQDCGIDSLSPKRPHLHILLGKTDPHMASVSRQQPRKRTNHDATGNPQSWPSTTWSSSNSSTLRIPVRLPMTSWTYLILIPAASRLHLIGEYRWWVNMVITGCPEVFSEKRKNSKTNKSLQRLHHIPITSYSDIWVWRGNHCLLAGVESHLQYSKWFKPASPSNLCIKVHRFTHSTIP